MSARLLRLRSVRGVELRVAIGDLAAAQRGASQAQATAARVERLIGELAGGPSLQAAAATRLTLTDARLRLAERCDRTTAVRGAAAEQVQRRKARCDVVDTAIFAARVRR